MRLNWKKFLTALLLLFVAVSVIYAVVNETGAVNEISEVSEGVTVYYFHGNMRCVSCTTVERLTEGSLRNEFSREIAENQLSIEIVNIEERENEHFVTDFELATRTVVIQDPSGNWRKLDRVWELTSDSTAFYNYITSEVEIELEVIR